MATNKWLSDMQTLRAETDNLRSALRTGGVSARDNDTLPNLISKVPSLAPLEMQDKWQPDPLWKFPDPNGSAIDKTIEEIYDEDTMAGDYTYRGIFQVRGDIDTVDLKWLTMNRTSADTFITSDGVTYTGITTANQMHTFDTAYDVIDSKGVPMRYIKVYTNTVLPTSFTCSVSGFSNQSVWIIYNLSTQGRNLTQSETTYNYSLQYAPIECIHFMEKITSISSFHLCYNVKKIIAYSSGFVGYNNYSLREGVLKGTDLSISTSGNFDFGYIKSLYIDDTNYTSSNLTLDGSSVYAFKIENLENLENLTSVTTLNIRNASGYYIQNFSLPPNIQTLSVSGIYCMNNILIPNTVTNLTLNYCAFNSLVIPDSVTTLSVYNLYNLKNITIPYNFNLNGLQLSVSYLLEADVLVTLFNNLADLTGQTAKTITLGTTLKAKLTTAELEIATDKNWTVA